MPSTSIRERVMVKVVSLVDGRFQGSFDRAMDYYDNNHDHKANKTEILRLLSDAGVGNMFTRNAVADAIFEEMDKDQDDLISLEEFHAFTLNTLSPIVTGSADWMLDSVQIPESKGNGN